MKKAIIALLAVLCVADYESALRIEPNNSHAQGAIENIKGKERFYLVQLRNGGGFYE